MRRILFAFAFLAGSTLGASAVRPLGAQHHARAGTLWRRAQARCAFTADGQWIYFRWLHARGQVQRGDEALPCRAGARPGPCPSRVPTRTWTPSRRCSRPGAAHATAAPRWSPRAVTSTFASAARAPRTGAITQDNGNESDPKFSLDEREIFFVRDNNVYAFDIASGLTRQLTATSAAAAPRPKEPEAPKGQRAALGRTSSGCCLEVIRDDIAADSAAGRVNAAPRRRVVSPWSGSRRPSASAPSPSVSPDGKRRDHLDEHSAHRAAWLRRPRLHQSRRLPAHDPGRPPRSATAQGTQKVGHLDIAEPARSRGSSSRPDDKARRRRVTVERLGAHDAHRWHLGCRLGLPWGLSMTRISDFGRPRPAAPPPLC